MVFSSCSSIALVYTLFLSDFFFSSKRPFIVLVPYLEQMLVARDVGYRMNWVRTAPVCILALCVMLNTCYTLFFFLFFCDFRRDGPRQ